MMTLHKYLTRNLRLGSALLALPFLCTHSLSLYADTEPVSGETVPPRIVGQNLVQYPRDVATLDGIRDGYAIVRFRVDTEGRASDLIAIEAVHPSYATAAIRGLRMTRFSPALVNGEPEEVITLLRIDFDSEPGSSVEVSTLEHVRDAMDSQRTQNPHFFALTPPNQLDEPLSVAEAPVPYVAVDDDGNPYSGQVQVQYYVDRDGSVKLPIIRSASNEHVAQVALRTVQEIRFNPPMKNGKPVPVRVVQPFRFGD